MDAPVIAAQSVIAENSDIWHDVVCRTYLEGSCSDLPAQLFHGKVSMVRLPEISLVRVCSVAQRFERTRPFIVRSEREIFAVLLQSSGSGLVSQDGREVLLNAGDLTFVDSTRPFAIHFDQNYDQLVVHLPRELIDRTLGSTQLLNCVRLALRLAQS